VQEKLTLLGGQSWPYQGDQQDWRLPTVSRLDKYCYLINSLSCPSEPVGAHKVFKIK